MMKVSNQIKGCIYGCIAAISYGVNPLCAKLLYKDGINCNSVLCYRFMIGTLLLALFMLLGRRSFSLTRKETYVLTLLGGVFAISSLTYFLSFHYMSAGVAATLVFAYPVFVAVLMAIFFKERLKWSSISAIALTIIGILLLYKDDSGRPIATPGIVLILLSALAYALYIIIINKSGIVMSSVKLTFYAMAVCWVCIVAYALLTPTGELQLLHGTEQWTCAITLGLVPTVISLVFMAMAIKCIGSTSTAVMGALEPVTSIVLGMLLLGESITLRISVGIVFILIAVMFIILDAKMRGVLSNTMVVKKGRLMIKKIRWR